jgi:RimJ/RimL family protein N-acetyltransferase
VSDRFAPRPIRLEHPVVTLAPLADEHAADLFAHGRDPDIWTHMPRAEFASPEDTLAWIHEAHAARLEGHVLAFAIVVDGEAVGSTRYLDIRPRDRGLEIGFTWIGAAHQRSAVNTACKLLLLRHAFDDLGAARVQLKTDARNLRSQRAIERLGAVHEGVLRHHYLVRHGFLRDSVYYSILATEWPQVQQRLEGFLAVEHPKGRG